MRSHIEFISQRGCWNAAMELSKLLLSLDPDGDPLGALLFIDYFALRARKYTYLRNMCNTWRTGKSLDWLPNFAYSEVSYSIIIKKERLDVHVDEFSIRSPLTPRAQALAYFLDSHETEDSSAVEALREQADARLQLALIRCVKGMSKAAQGSLSLLASRDARPPPSNSLIFSPHASHCLLGSHRCSRPWQTSATRTFGLSLPGTAIFRIPPRPLRASAT
jgi:hypothetical protein